ncbi:MAG TPA: hypothetical protein VH040_07030 [Usitatibacter sp.]|jgi:hypothetical protein|nr:hypothetical protein [Usitatibacter sp.]
MNDLRILWISAGRAVLEDIEGTRLDVLLNEMASDEKMIARLSPIDAFRLGYQAAMFQGK